LNCTHAMPFRRARNRHGTAKYRRNEEASNEAAAIALAIAASATIHQVTPDRYRHAFPIDAYSLPTPSTLSHA
jgi:hypothetical protein